MTAAGHDWTVASGGFPVGYMTMEYAPNVVLDCPAGYRMELDSLVEQFLVCGVKSIGVVGKDCELVEDIIDELVVGDGTDSSRYILTSAHPGDSVADVIEFSRAFRVLATVKLR